MVTVFGRGFWHDHHWLTSMVQGWALRFIYHLIAAALTRKAFLGESELIIVLNLLIVKERKSRPNDAGVLSF